MALAKSLSDLTKGGRSIISPARRVTPAGTMAMASTSRPDQPLMTQRYAHTACRHQDTPALPRSSNETTPRSVAGKTNARRGA
jgi:hypothetical protein